MCTKIKICGLQRPEDVEYVNQWKPDYIGFILADGFRRRITPEQARILAEKLHPDILRVGVFVNQPVEFVSEMLDRGIIQIAQLHGDEDESFIHALRERCKQGASGENPHLPGTRRVEIIKAVKVRTAEDIESAKGYSSDYLLLDAWSAKGAGGNGETFDWSLIQNINKPYFLAGGLAPENVMEAVERLHPFGVDASSSLETDGFKDAEKIRRFIAVIRNS